jgi:hypothetical protein
MTVKILMAVAVLGCLLGIAGIIYGYSTDQAQARQIAALTHRLHAEQAALAAITVKAAGQHRDLITCGDLQNLVLEASGVDSAGDTVTTQTNPGPVQLPAHCINQ